MFIPDSRVPEQKHVLFTFKYLSNMKRSKQSYKMQLTVQIDICVHFMSGWMSITKNLIVKIN